MRARVCTALVSTRTCAPVYERAMQPRSRSAMQSSAIETCSPVASRTSISRASGSWQRPLARSTRRSVLSPIAETTTTTFVTVAARCADSLGDAPDEVERTDRGTAVFLDDQRQLRRALRLSFRRRAARAPTVRRWRARHPARRDWCRPPAPCRAAAAATADLLRDVPIRSPALILPV